MFQTENLVALFNMENQERSMSNHIFYASVDTPIPSPSWKNLLEYERVKRINQMIFDCSDFENQLLAISAKEDGNVVVRFLTSVPADKRGTLLLDFETILKANIDEGLTVWGEALGDKNSLRNLRGIEVKVS
jgi:hypothetical protein